MNKLKYIYYSATFTKTEFEHIEYIITKFENPLKLKNNMPENVPDKKTSAIAGFNNVLSLLYGLFYNENIYYITVSALNNFVKNGRIAQFPESYFDSLSVRQRIDMLTMQKEAAVKKKYNIKLINPTKLRYSSHTFDSDSENILNVSGFCDSEINADSFLGNFSVLIKDKSIVRDFSNTFDFIQKNNYIYSDEYYINYIDDCIKELERKILY